MGKAKINLTILKRMVSELESSILRVDAITGVTSADKVETIVELNKATGLAAGVLTEAGLLMGDIQYLISGGAGQNDASKNDFIKQLLGGLGGSKGSGNAN